MSFLDPHAMRLHREEHHTLRLESPHMSTHVAAVKRALPLSEPGKFLVLADHEGDEIGVVRDLNELDDASREALSEVLARAYSMTHITRILEVEREPLTGQVRWRVEIASDEETEAIAEQPLLTALDQLEPQAVRPDDVATTSEDSSEGDGASEADGKLLGRLRRRLRSDKTEDDGIATQEREFSISGQEDVQTARYPHIYIVDTERNRYQIPDCEALDLESRRAAESYF